MAPTQVEPPRDVRKSIEELVREDRRYLIAFLTWKSAPAMVNTIYLGSV
jgi:hypothetical protein